MAQLDRATLTWEIKDFANFNYFFDSRYFETKKAIFWLSFYPKAHLKSNHIAIYLRREIQDHTANLKAMYTICVINDKGEECFLKDIETNFTVDSTEGDLYHLDRDTILRPSSGLLPDGKLIVKCTVTIIDDEINFARLWIEHKSITLAQKKAFANYETLLDSSKLSDVVFVIGEKEFKLHKAILASQSPVFSAMFENDLEEAKQNRVEITDIDLEVFEAMIRFIYTANVDSVQQYALDLFVAADKYQLDSLKDICEQSLGFNLSIESVSNILQVADMHSAHELKSKCLQFIKKNRTNVFATDGWKQLVNGSSFGKGQFCQLMDAVFM